jgi:hypothetical protein
LVAGGFGGGGVVAFHYRAFKAWEIAVLEHVSWLDRHDDLSDGAVALVKEFVVTNNITGQHKDVLARHITFD